MTGMRGAQVAEERRARVRVDPFPERAAGLRLRAADVVVLDLGAGLRLRGAGVRVVAIARTPTFDTVRRVPPAVAAAMAQTVADGRLELGLIVRSTISV